MKKADINHLIDRWEVAGVVSAEQASYMKADVTAVTSEVSGNRFISAIMYIGATALSLGALLLIATNWSGLTKGIKLVLTILLPLVPLCFAYWQLIMQQSDRVLGRAANILGLALVGGSLALIGQIYNLESNMVSFFWTWTLLTSPFIFVYKKTENALFAAVLIGAATLYSLIEFIEASDIAEEAAVLLLTFASLAYAALLYAVGSGLRQLTAWVDGGRLLRLGGAGLATSVLFVTTFEWYARLVVGGSWRSPGNWEPLSIVFNLIFIGFLVFALLRSVKFEEYSFAFSIVRLFGVYLLVKYYTLFYSMLDTGIFFIIGGALFIAGGWLLEKHKKLLITYMQGTSHSL